MISSNFIAFLFFTILTRIFCSYYKFHKLNDFSRHVLNSIELLIIHKFFQFHLFLSIFLFNSNFFHCAFYSTFSYRCFFNSNDFSIFSQFYWDFSTFSKFSRFYGYMPESVFRNLFYNYF